MSELQIRTDLMSTARARVRRVIRDMWSLYEVEGIGDEVAAKDGVLVINAVLLQIVFEVNQMRGAQPRLQDFVKYQISAFNDVLAKQPSGATIHGRDQT
jgi:hypothetical protein